MYSHFIIFAFVAFAFGVRVQKSSPKTYVKEFTAYIFFWSFMLSASLTSQCSDE